MSDWQSIETAPKDGTFIWLATTAGPTMRVGFWSAVGQWNDLAASEGTGPRGLRFTPTHWQPLPKPPQAEQRLEAKVNSLLDLLEDAAKIGTWSVPEGEDQAIRDRIQATLAAHDRSF